MKVVEKTGKTADEAVQAALEELNVPRDQVEVEILTASSKGSLFGLFGGREAKVRVTLRDTEVITETGTVKAEAVEAVTETAETPEPVISQEADSAKEADRKSVV